MHSRQRGAARQVEPPHFSMQHDERPAAKLRVCGFTLSRRLLTLSGARAHACSAAQTRARFGAPPRRPVALYKRVVSSLGVFAG